MTCERAMAAALDFISSCFLHRTSLHHIAQVPDRSPDHSLARILEHSPTHLWKTAGMQQDASSSGCHRQQSSKIVGVNDADTYHKLQELASPAATSSLKRRRKPLLQSVSMPRPLKMPLLHQPQLRRAAIVQLPPEEQALTAAAFVCGCVSEPLRYISCIYMLAYTCLNSTWSRCNVAVSYVHMLLAYAAV